MYGTDEDHTILDSVTELERNAFLGCKRLKRITVSDGNRKYYSRDYSIFEKESDEVWILPKGK